MLFRRCSVKRLTIIVAISCLVLLVFTKLSHSWHESVDKSNTGTKGEKTKQVTNELSKVDLVILIMSAPAKSVTRNVLRETWLTNRGPRVRHFFVIGSADLSADSVEDIRLENSTHGDIVLLEKLRDSYTSLTEKVILSFQWLHSNVTFRFMLKCDEDSFVRIPELLEELKLQPQERLYWGFFKGGSTVYRTGKWKETDWFVCDSYLPYALGGGYILSSDLIAYLSNNSPLLQRYKGEDVSVGLWLSPLKLNRVHDVRFDTEYKSRGCFNSYLITHKQTASDMREKYLNLKNTGKLCSTEVHIKYSYNYNWTVPPSKCCKNYDPTLP
nr:EOG090X0A8N [Sida crystallina]